MRQLSVNGMVVKVDADGSTPLLWVLRDHLGLTGTKFGCGIGACGACTVHESGRPIRSCLTTHGAVKGPIATIESVANDRIGMAVQRAWIKVDVVQCGYCQSGQIMAAVSLLRTRASPTDAEINHALSGNLCRCRTYQRIRAAVKEAARSLATT